MSAQSEYENDIKQKDHTTTFHLLKDDKSKMMKKYFEMASCDPAKKERAQMIEKCIKFVEVLSAVLKTLSNIIAKFLYYHQQAGTKLQKPHFKELCIECAKVAKKGYDEVHGNEMSIMFPCLLSTIVDASPIKHSIFFFQLSKRHENDSNSCVPFFPSQYKNGAIFGISETLYNYRMAINYINIMERLNTSSRSNIKIWMEQMWVMRALSYFMIWLRRWLRQARV